MFEEIDLQQFFKSEINVNVKLMKNVCSKLGTSFETIAQNFSGNGWG